MPIPERLYTLALHAARPLLPLLSRGEGKLARGIRGRSGVLRRMEAWARAHREPHHPLVWFHAPSVGEGFQARAVIEALRRRRPELQIVYSYFSPSAEGFARSVPADFTDYLPLDLPAQVERALALLRPEVIAFTKTEVWPNLAGAAQRRGVRLALLSATLPSGSSRLSMVARPFLLPAFRRLDRLAAISAADAERFGVLGVPPERRLVMGDARFDQVWKRAEAVDRDSALLRPLHDGARVTLVAGSTWPPDEERLIPALKRAIEGAVPFRLILVPHEPTPDHLTRTEALLKRHALSSRRLGELNGEALDAEVLLVDRVGVLGELYALADVGYVGGGFGTAGLHSVLEPAAFGVPVLFGPRHGNAREAAELIACGAGFAVADERELRERLAPLLRDAGERFRAGAAARAYVEAGLGAAERGAQVVEELLEGIES
jgi:3-deoxy-D-manno-octulosonic-acid transferase